MNLLSTSEAADALNLTIGRVQQLIWEGRLPAQKIGNRYVIKTSDLKLVEGIKRGRPPKTKLEQSGKRKGGKK